MKCPTLQQIYLYLEKELPSPENRKIEDHLQSCSKCRSALEERKFLLQAIESLPSLRVPAGFTQQVMSRIFPARVTLMKWITAFALGFSTFILTVFIYLRATGQNLPSLFLRLHYFLWEQMKNISLIFIKLFKLVLLSFKILHQLGTLILKGFLQLTTIINPEVQSLILLILILTSTLIYGMRRKFLSGEK